MARFSERYGYTEPTSVLIRGSMPEEVQNAILSAYDLLRQSMASVYGVYNPQGFYVNMEEYIWRHFLNRRLKDFYGDSVARHAISTWYLEAEEHLWYDKLDCVYEALQYLLDKAQTQDNLCSYYEDWLSDFTTNLNSEFERLNYAYRIIDNQIVEITSEEEIRAIETAVQNSSASVKAHLNTALQLLAKRPEGDYRNSIKESISAVEAVVREITGAKTLDFAALERKGVILPEVIREAFKKLYGYANDASTGIRHALMDDANAPGADEAIFMLVSCSAFINYLAKKRT